MLPCHGSGSMGIHIDWYCIIYTLQSGQFALCGGDLPRPVLMSSIYFLLNFVNLPRAFYKLANLVYTIINNITTKA